MADSVEKWNRRVESAAPDQWHAKLTRVVQILTDTKGNKELQLNDEEIALRGLVAETVCRALFDLANPDEVNAALKERDILLDRIETLSGDVEDPETRIAILQSDRDYAMGVRDGLKQTIEQLRELLRYVFYVRLPLGEKVEEHLPEEYRARIFRALERGGTT